MTPFSEPSHLRGGGGTSQVLLKITSLLKYEEESELSVSGRNLLEKSAPVALEPLSQPPGSTLAMGIPGSHLSKATAGPSQIGRGSSC